MKLSFGFSRNEKLLFRIAAILSVLCFTVFMEDRLFFTVDRHSDVDAQTPRIGMVSSVRNDVRLKVHRRFDWENADKKNIYLGDSIYSGKKSGASIELGEKQKIDVGPESLVRFVNIGQREVSDLSLGNFRLRVDGQMDVAVQGQITHIEGRKSEIQVFFDQQAHPKFRLLRGEASVIRTEKVAQTVAPRKVRQLALDQVTDMIVAEEIHPVAVAAAPAVEAPPVVITPAPEAEAPPVVATTAPAVETPPVAETPALEEVTYNWKLYDIFELSNGILLERDRPLEPKIVGNFHVTTAYLAVSPKLQTRSQELDLRGELVNALLSWEHRPDDIGYLLESSVAPEFQHGTTRFDWVPAPTIRIAFRRAGLFFYRVRRVNRDQEVSLPSEVTRFLVSIPLRLASTPNVKKDLKSVVKAQGKPAPKLEVHERKVASTDAPKEAPPRAATSNLHLAETENDWRLNDAYSASLLQLAMGSEGMLSSDQQVQNQDPSLTAEFELRGFKWWDRVGAEASVQSQTLGLNGTSRQTQTLSIQAQGHYRWTVPWHWFSFLREVQLSALLGAEAYRSAGTHDYSQGYNLLKTGFTLEFPLGSRWFTGGELLYGEALDASYKYEASGHLNYFIRRQWSCGAGYRVQFFQAGSSASSPSGLPYREAYGQTDLMLRYSF